MSRLGASIAAIGILHAIIRRRHEKTRKLAIRYKEVHDNDSKPELDDTAQKHDTTKARVPEIRELEAGAEWRWKGSGVRMHADSSLSVTSVGFG